LSDLWYDPFAYDEQFDATARRQRDYRWTVLARRPLIANVRRPKHTGAKIEDRK
jgi:hypothetical protein